MYSKNSLRKSRQSRLKLTSVVFVFIVCLIGVLIVTVANTSNKSSTTTNGTSIDTSLQADGTVKVLGQTAKPLVSGGATADDPALKQTTNDLQPITFPQGWQVSPPTTENNPCEVGKTTTTTIYTNGTKTITVYENGSPTGCDNSFIADTYLDFDYSQDTKSLVVNGADAMVFCTKEQNPQCPRGDGKITAFIGNRTDSGALIQHPFRKKTYFFKVENVANGPDLNSQVRELIADLVQIKF